ncbi:MAG TPA: hypothetical protein VF285_06400 [Castellaniella sp.]|uniref:hypothetical protein n=1 Tax=Castellaniella sp. TaxID=1955812 RepID=UPI002F0C917C
MSSTRAVPPRLSRDRQLQIELLRMRAGYERLQFRQSACSLADALRPGAWVARARDHLESTGLGWLGLGLRASRRFPMLLSLASALWPGGGRRQVLLKCAFVVGLFWLVRHPAREDDAAD